jgi:hypothetical protein
MVRILGKLDVQRRQLAIIGRPLISLIILIAGLLELSKKWVRFT